MKPIGYVSFHTSAPPQFALDISGVYRDTATRIVPVCEIEKARELYAALQELVRLKDLHDEEARLRQRRVVYFKRDQDEVARAQAMHQEYMEAKPKAWAVARRLLEELK